MKFPNKKYHSFEKFSSDYLDMLSDDIRNINFNIFEKILILIENTIKKKRTLFVCGNGGSAAIANHFVCDYLKYIRTFTDIKPNIISLSTNVETITAISNDFTYDDIFSYQLDSLASKGDTLLAISSSGNSKNIVKVINLANKIGLSTISFTGFGGGTAHRKSKFGIKFNSCNYGVVEDMHHTLMHLICQFIRQKYLKKNIKKTSF